MYRIGITPLPVAIMVLIVLKAAPTAAQPGVPLPADVAGFIQTRELCDHFRGEPYDNDPDRRAFLARQMTRYCAGTDAALAALKRKYSATPLVMKRLDTFEPCIEAQSPCLPEAVGR